MVKLVQHELFGLCAHLPCARRRAVRLTRIPGTAAKPALRARCAHPRRPRPPGHEIRDYLSVPEVGELLAAARLSSDGARDHAMILIAFRHALRASEVTELRFGQLDFVKNEIYCRRLKGSISNAHPLAEDEVQALMAVMAGRQLKPTDYVFLSRHGGAPTRNRFWQVVDAAGKRAGFAFPVYPHMLKHATGYYLGGEGKDVRLIQEYMGHKCIANTIRYVRVNAKRFLGLWSEPAKSCR